jgi:predicted nuclease of predicted toxin-antitoxin system
MKILLDENMPRPFRQYLTGHDVKTVQQKGWGGKRNGELLQLISGNFDVFITVDKNILYQQNVGELPFALIILIAKTNRLDDLVPLVPKLQHILDEIQPTQIVEIRADHAH